MVDLKINVDVSEAIEALNSLKRAAEEADAAISNLGIGCEVTPSKGDLGALLRMHSSESK